VKAPHRLCELAVCTVLANAALLAAAPQDPPPQDPPPQAPAEPTADDPVLQLDDVTEPETPVGTARRPFLWFRVGSAEVLGEGEFRTDFRFQKHDDGASGTVGVAYGLFDRVQLDLRVGTGDQHETILDSVEPGLFADLGVQWQFVRTQRFTMSTRLDAVLSDEASFEEGAEGLRDEDLVERRYSRASVQPSLQAIYRTGNVDLFAEFGGRIGDTTEEAYEVGTGVSVPIGRAAFVGEFSYVYQNRDRLERNDDYGTSYFTPGIVFWPRERLEIHLGPSFGLTSESYDWSLQASLAVRF
jgi:hypothetical protein